MAETKNSVHKVQKEVLPNGLVVITEPMEHMHSVSVGIWLRAGSRREPAELNGISHFIEHMVFKGSARRKISRGKWTASVECSTRSPRKKWSASIRACSLSIFLRLSTSLRTWFSNRHSPPKISTRKNPSSWKKSG